MKSSSHFIEQSLLLLRERALLLFVAALLCAVAVTAFALWQPPLYRSTAVLTLTDWQAERLSRRDPALDKNPANVGGAAADEMSRALVILKAPAFWAELNAQPSQLSLEHKRRGNLVELRWSSNEAGKASAQLTQLVQQWDQQLRQAFIAERRQLLTQVADPVFQAEQQQAERLSPFALKWLQQPTVADQPLSRPWYWWALFAAVAGFMLLFQTLLYKRLRQCMQ